MRATMKLLGICVISLVLPGGKEQPGFDGSRNPPQAGLAKEERFAFGRIMLESSAELIPGRAYQDGANAGSVAKK